MNMKQREMVTVPAEGLAIVYEENRALHEELVSVRDRCGKADVMIKMAEELIAELADFISRTSPDSSYWEQDLAKRVDEFLEKIKEEK